MKLKRYLSSSGGREGGREGEREERREGGREGGKEGEFWNVVDADTFHFVAFRRGRDQCGEERGPPRYIFINGKYLK